MGFARQVAVPELVATAQRNVRVLDDGGFLLNASIVGAPGSIFHVFDADGQRTRSFGDRGSAPASRSIAYGGRETFWAAPPSGAPNGYVLEEWSLKGERARTLVLNPDWLRRSVESGKKSGTRALPEFQIHVDESGLIWVRVITKDARWRPLRPGESEDEMETQLYDWRYEVIDPDAGIVLASGVEDEMPGEDGLAPPLVLFVPRTSKSYRPLADSLGLESIEFFDARLTARVGRR
jgi:hypothetical protein